MKCEYCRDFDELREFIIRKDIKIKFINTSAFSNNGYRMSVHYVFYKEKILPKIIKTILKKKSSSKS